MNLKNLADFLARLEPVPDEWYTEKNKSSGDKVAEVETTPAIEPLECTSYAELREAWQLAVQWDYAVDVTFTSMLATVASTMMPSDQLWLRVIGRPGTLKSTLSAAIAGCKEYVFEVSKFKGIHSGWIGKGDGGKDHSLIPRMNHKTTIINEADTLLKATNLPEILSELRDVYSGKSKADYRHGKSEEYNDLRTSLILCGTPTVRRLNRSAAGDRFLDSIIHEKRTAQEETTIVRNVMKQDFLAMLKISNGQVVDTRQLSKEMMFAYRKTVGYVIYLRENADRLIQEIQTGVKKVVPTFTDDCESLGHLVARMRTRPSGEDEEETEAEFHVRLSKQLMKLGIATAMVLNSDIDSEVMRRVARIARDTCYGDVFIVAKALLGKARPDKAVQLELGHSSIYRVNRAITVLKAVECVNVEFDKTGTYSGKVGSKVLRLTPLCTGLLTRLKVLLGTPTIETKESDAETTKRLNAAVAKSKG